MLIPACMALAVFAGMLVSMQPGINNIVSRAIMDPIATAAISGFMTFLAAVIVMLFTTRGQLTVAAFSSVPWWAYFAGMLGLAFVGGSIVMVPIIGALLFFVCFVAGNLIGAIIADHVGAFGLPERHITWQRILGMLFVLGGAIMVQRG